MIATLPDNPAARVVRLSDPMVSGVAIIAADPAALVVRTPFRASGPETGDFDAADFNPDDFFTG